MPTTIRVMFVGQGASNLAEDRFVNVFHFRDEIAIKTYETELAFIFESLERFYTLPQTSTETVGNFISPWVHRDALLVGYDLSTTEPREPTEFPITLPAAAGNGLPEEVAICLSLHGAPPVNARRRGRIYVGPLTDSPNVIIGATTAIRSRPNTQGGFSITQTLLQAATALQVDQAARGMPWCIRSTVPSENYVPIVGGYVDDAFDIQRRRGPGPLSREVWGA